MGGGGPGRRARGWGACGSGAGGHQARVARADHLNHGSMRRLHIAHQAEEADKLQDPRFGSDTQISLSCWWVLSEIASHWCSGMVSKKPEEARKKMASGSAPLQFSEDDDVLEPEANLWIWCSQVLV